MPLPERSTWPACFQALVSDGVGQGPRLLLALSRPRTAGLCASPKHQTEAQPTEKYLPTSSLIKGDMERSSNTSLKTKDLRQKGQFKIFPKNAT